MELVETIKDDTITTKLPKKSKETKYYYKHREEILEKKRLARLAKKGVDITNTSTEAKLTLEERRKKKMEFLGLTGEKVVSPAPDMVRVPSGVESFYT